MARVGGSRGKLAILVHRLSPYHRPRFRTLSESQEIIAIEFSSIDLTYAWRGVDAREEFRIKTVFPDVALEEQRPKVVWNSVCAALSDVRPTVVAIPGWSSPASLAAVSWCCTNGIPAILMSDSAEHDEPRVAWKEWIKKRVVKLYSSALVAGKPHLDYVGALGLPRVSAFTGYDVVDNDHFESCAYKARLDGERIAQRFGLPRLFFLASSRFVEKKNLLRLLAAYSEYLSHCEEIGWDFVLLGDGPLKSELLEQVDRLGLASRVHLPGFKQYDELPVYYGLAQAFIHASTTEQWGLVVNEAMASGLPVLVSNRCGCAPDLVEDGINGFTFDPFDVDDIAKQMIQVSGVNCDRAAMGRASQRIICDWSPATFAAGMLRAADAALFAPRPRYGLQDRVLLWALMRR